MFINLSNHPSANWSREQLEAARSYGEVVDLSFPVIESSFTKDDILRYVKKYVEMIQSVKDDDTVVHVMGEMTFTYNLVNALKKLGLTCLASTTERIATENDDGTKLSEFSFTKFREY